MHYVHFASYSSFLVSGSRLSCWTSFGPNKKWSFVQWGMHVMWVTGICNCVLHLVSHCISHCVSYCVPTCVSSYLLVPIWNFPTVTSGHISQRKASRDSIALSSLSLWRTLVPFCLYNILAPAVRSLTCTGLQHRGAHYLILTALSLHPGYDWGRGLTELLNKRPKHERLERTSF